MPMCAFGSAKVVEETGEFQAVLGKLVAYWGAPDHPDGAGNLFVRLCDEGADVMAALAFWAGKLLPDEFPALDCALPRYSLDSVDLLPRMFAASQALQRCATETMFQTQVDEAGNLVLMPQRLEGRAIWVSAHEFARTFSHLADFLGLPRERINTRAGSKCLLFQQWDHAPDNDSQALYRHRASHWNGYGRQYVSQPASN
jgi:hypothetical protein